MRPFFAATSFVAAGFAFLGCLEAPDSPAESLVAHDGTIPAGPTREMSASSPGELGCGPAFTCDDADPCTVDTCVAGNGCQHAPAANGTACDDGNACTQIDECRSGACRGSDLVTCATPDSCHDRGVCDPATGACVAEAKADGAPCDDGNACTDADTCKGGSCSGAEVSCDADHCHAQRGTCNPSTGFCAYPAAVPPPPRCTFTIDGAADGTGTCAEDRCVEGASRFRRGQCRQGYLCVPE